MRPGSGIESAERSLVPRHGSTSAFPFTTARLTSATQPEIPVPTCMRIDPSSAAWLPAECTAASLLPSRIRIASESYGTSAARRVEKIENASAWLRNRPPGAPALGPPPQPHAFRSGRCGARARGGFHGRKAGPRFGAALDVNIGREPPWLARGASRALLEVDIARSG